MVWAFPQSLTAKISKNISVFLLKKLVLKTSFSLHLLNILLYPLNQGTCQTQIQTARKSRH